jgi:hypothetical protein
MENQPSTILAIKIKFESTAFPNFAIYLNHAFVVLQDFFYNIKAYPVSFHMVVQPPEHGENLVFLSHIKA